MVKITNPNRFFNHVLICPAIIGVVLFCSWQAKLNYRKLLEETIGVGAITTSGHLTPSTNAEGEKLLPQRNYGAGRGLEPFSVDDGSAPTLPLDPLQRCAAKVERGDFDATLKPWQRDAYRLAVERGATVSGQAWVTCYGPNEGRQGRVTASGTPVSNRVAAANKIKRGSYVWIAQTRGGGATMRQILDCGSKRNDRIARDKGARLWIDLWVPRADSWSTVTDYAVIGGK